MRPLRYSINVTLDGCCHHEAGLPPDEESMRYWTDEMERADGNAELVRGDLGQAVQRLKQEPGEGLFVGGVTLPLALADLGLIDEYEFLVQPVLAGHGPTLLAGLRERIQLDLVDRHEFRSGAVAVRYRPTRVAA
jgi:dihydrofolate reductase